jgi:phosphoketolase
VNILAKAYYKVLIPEIVDLTTGYTLTGRTGIFPSYEAFLGIVHTMMVQYAKFIKMTHECEWRKDVGSLNYIETSTWTRQEHNGFSHQNPSFIGAVLNLKEGIKRVYLPPDANCFLSTVAHCMRSKVLSPYFSAKRVELHQFDGGIQTAFSRMVDSRTGRSPLPSWSVYLALRVH